MSEAPVAIFKRGKGRPATARKRSVSPSAPSAAAAASSEPSTSSSSSAVVRPSKKNAGNLLSSGTKRTASERALQDDAVDVHWSTSGAQSVTSSALEILQGDEAEEMLAKRQRLKGPDDEDDVAADGMYHGLKAYGNKIKKQQEVPKTMRVGPVRMNGGTIRTATIVDYQPDVCKDYKETGYCGFGDSCKFLHDRGTYLSGWQIDQKWDAAQRARANGAGAEESSSDSDEDIPFACLICRQPYTDPVVTRCGHYYCSACAIKRFAKTPKCLACGAPTNGIFNRAEKVIEKMRKAKEANAEDAGEDGSGGEGGVQVEGLDNASDDDE
ncbi:hypothetical protein EXIGLDRAFT_760458 [Exidia glandulosa HHB12029]|uniref:Pre-mRNA-splicing factor CWC24 n=1 Tax=Exidia glandulosa HHB12029 TaxID=1314781 RepID=A0A165P9R5_EXIGL|nr:hypothetical protein EXIGLDRAFT_760458 [Exidia glandulosa HHB12029]